MRGPTPIPLIERFWAKVKKTKKCWLWTAHTNNRGYGQIYVREHKKKELAHRAAWFLATGEWPTKLVLHKCDNPRCVRHSHHFEGTATDNAKDSIAKGRHGYGKEASDIQRRKTHCSKGHPYSGDNLLFRHHRGHTFRLCRTCNKANCKAYHQSRKH